MLFRSRIDLARQVRRTFEQAAGVVDVDWYVDGRKPRTRLDVDVDRAGTAGVSASSVAMLVRLAGAGAQAGLLHDALAREDVPIVLRLPRELRSSVDALRSIRVGAGSSAVAIGELTRQVEIEEEQSIYHKNLQPVTYVTGDVAGSLLITFVLRSIKVCENYARNMFYL